MISVKLYRRDGQAMSLAGTLVFYGTPVAKTDGSSWIEFEADDQPYAVFVDNNLGSRPDYLRRLCQALRPLEKIWSAAVTIDVTDDPSLVREMALGGCTGVFVGFESLNDEHRPRQRQCKQCAGSLRSAGR